MNANAFLKRLLLLVAISALSVVNVTYAHGGGHGSGGSGGSSGGSGSSGGGGHSGGSASGGHAAGSTSVGHSATASGHAATTSKSKDGHPAADPVSVSQSPNPTFQHVRVFRIFQQVPSTGYTTQYRETNDEDWRRKHQRLFLGFIRY